MLTLENQVFAAQSTGSAGGSGLTVSVIPGQVTMSKRESNGHVYPLTLSSITPLAPLPLLVDPAILMRIVQLPQQTVKNHWLSTHTVDFVRLISLLSLYLSKSAVCTLNTCGCMNCGNSFEYLWKTNEQPPVRYPASTYMDLLLQDVETKINDEDKFPTQGRDYPEDFEQVIQYIYQRLFRVFTHAYTAHYGAIKQLRLDISFNTVFIHFMCFSAEFNLIPVSALVPAKDLLRTICGPIALRMAQNQSPTSPEDKSMVESVLADIEMKLRGISERIGGAPDAEPNQQLLVRQRKLQARAQELKLPGELVSYFANDLNQSDLFSCAAVESISSENLHAEIAVACNSIKRFYKTFVNNSDLYIDQHRQYRRKKTTLNDFKLFTLIGRGAYGEVKLCQYKRDPKGQVYVIKMVNKEKLIRKGHVEFVCEERNAMVELSRRSEGLVKLHETFQDANNLYFVEDFCQAGDMMWWLIKKDKFSESVARFYTAELILALRDLHRQGFAHRDLKPDNILVVADGHIKLADFGFTKRIPNPNPNSSAIGDRPAVLERAPIANPSNANQVSTAASRLAEESRRVCFFSTVGSPGYIAPEVLLQTGHDESVDWWAVGIILPGYAVD